MNDESTPKKGAHESATTDLSLSDGTDICRDQLARIEGKLDHVRLSLEDRHAAYCAGLEDGMARRVEIEIEDAVHDALHAQALEALGMARRSAVHGSEFSAMVTEAGERP